MSTTSIFPNVADVDPAELRIGDTFEWEPGLRVTVTRTSHDADGRFASVLATSDGRIANVDRWHQGNDGGMADAVFYVRLTPAGGSHGWVHPQSRLLLQVG